VIENHLVPEWRVEKRNEDGSYERVNYFRGPDSRRRAIDARQHFGEFDEITLEPVGNR